MSTAPSTNARPSAAAIHKTKRVGDLLVKRGLINSYQLEQALTFQKEKAPGKLLGAILAEMGFVKEADVIATIGEAYDVPFATVHTNMVDANVLGVFSREFMERNNLLPIVLVDDRLTLAMQDFTNVFLIEEAARLSGYKIHVITATPDNIKDVRHALLSSGEAAVAADIVEQIAEDDLAIVQEGGKDEDLSALASEASESPIIKLVNAMIVGAVHERASDIHLEAAPNSTFVRYRIDGVLFDKPAPPQRMYPAVVSRIKIMAAMDISERRVPQDGGLAVVVGGRSIDLRVSTMPGKFGEKVVLRIIDNQRTALDLGVLGFEPKMLAQFCRAIREPNGVILVTGPTGSGKSTTLYACLKELIDPAVNICTIEDPVENILPRVNQFQVNNKAGFTFPTSLRALLRQDPDIIMVGEIRDDETAQIAIQAALTGHLVLSTLHTNDAPSAVTRLVNMGVEGYLVAASIRCVLAQRLLRKICEHCKAEVEPTPAVQRALAFLSPDAPITKAYKGAGCVKCRNTGYWGRVGVYELLVPDERLLDAVSRGVSLQEPRRHAADAGHITLLQDARNKVEAGVTSLDEIFDVLARPPEEDKKAA